MKKKNTPKSKQKTKEIKKEVSIGVMPMGDRVLIRPFRETEEMKVGNIRIVLPESVANEKSDRGKVVAVGAGKWEDGKLRPVQVKAGDTVIFSRYGYDEVKANGEDLYLVKEDNILAVLK
ncbi:co-chaperone GroES [Candidatus Parcubacteria bacterium]|nr:co-chaperone GroES [Candidatus Parcubacteria bacterium]